MRRTSTRSWRSRRSGWFPAVLAKVRPSGNYSKRVRIPEGKTPKRYRISARCGGGNLGVSRRIRVLAPL